ncbi:efflux RND transporter permease subunit [Neokomagataea thailandica]|uniref:Cobalt/zinc/cadmium resistance heavy metal efflux pump protein CzcA n=1 Tax=Neokomagataea tanensis NBRC 106556 TaxID=1223519 RepID=A0ABQ0QKZ9_9PROT|nr:MULTISPECIES: CusA/CzcA family heavy metal efflux RND transporter [Neokomagataea]GBR48554.1 cobalt/zinc/cadmium resistance heavy metal efflux pump protein CzcA [Neokomagataea tanensis NBRC 106556]
MLGVLQKNRFLVLGFIIAVVVAGTALIPGLPVEPVPDISPQQVMVSVTVPGLATEEIETLVTVPVEAAFTGIPGLEDVRSVSRTGVSAVYLQFADATDIDLDRARVVERMSGLRSAITLPGAEIHIGPRATGMSEIMQLEIKGDGYSPMALNRMMTWTVAPMLRLVPGVADVNVNGGAEETFNVALRPERLRAFNVTVADVDQALEANNAASGGGWIARQAESQVVVGRALVTSLDVFGSIPVKMGAAGHVVRLRDLGEISHAARTRLGAVTRDGKGEIVNGVVLMQIGASSNATLAAIRGALPGIQQALPPGVTLDPFYSRATLTGQTLGTIKENLALGAVLVFGVLLVVLGDWRASLAIVSVIPVSLVCAMVGMRFFGVSANLLSLGAIDFGMIVDGALVIVEHLMVERKRNRDPAALPRMAAETVRLVARPVIFAITVIIMVYLPILTLQGIEGKMFRPMAQTVIMALVVSLLYGLLGMPVVAALMLRRSPEERETRLIAWLRRYYERALAWCGQKVRLVLMVVLGALMLSAVVASRLGGEFVPQLEEGALIVTSMRLPSASLETVLQGVTQQEKILRRFPEVQTVVSNTGTSAIPTDPMGTSETDSFIFLKPRDQWRPGQTQERLVQAMNAALLHDLPDADYSWSQPIQMRMDDLLAGVRSQVAISVYGDDLGQIMRLADHTAAVLKHIPGAADVAVQGDGDVSFLRIDVNRDAASRLGVSVSDILAEVEAVGGHIGKPVTQRGAIIPTQAQFVSSATETPEKIARLQVRRADGQGWVLLGEVAQIHAVDGPPRIDHDGLSRRVIVQANVRGRDVASFVHDAQQAVGRGVVLPHGYRMSWAGQFRNLESAMHRLGVVVPIALALIYVLLVVALGSPGAAALVFGNLPAAATGGVLMLALRGLPFSIAAGIGFIALFGVAILNGVVLVSQIGVYRQAGMLAGEAAFAAARSRFRPVMATALVATLGFFPMAFSGGAGAEVERPLASVVIGGLISSTLLTLLVLPSVYALFFGRKK